MPSDHLILKLKQGYIDKYDGIFEDIVQFSANPFVAGFLDGRMVYWNNAFEQLTGYNSEELWNMNWIHTLTPQKEESLSRMIKGKKQITISDRWLRRKDGRLVPIKFTIRQARYPGENFTLYYGFISDISKEKELQDALYYQNAFKKLLYNSAVRFITLDSTQIYAEITNTLGYVGNFIKADNGIVILLKDNGEGILHTCEWSAYDSQTYASILPDPLQSDLSNILNNLHLSRHSRGWEYALALATAEVNKLLGEESASVMVLPMISDSNLLGFLGYTTIDRRTWAEQDITLIKTMSEIFIDALGRTKAKLRLDIGFRLMDIISEGIIVFTPEEIRWVNQAFTSLTGYNYGEVLGRSFSSFSFTQLTNQQLEELELCLSTMGRWRGNVLARHKNGSTFACQLAINSLPRTEGGLDYSVAIFTDISQEYLLKRQQLRLQELNAAIQKSASLSAMSAGIVHEIAQPLNSIKMIIQSLRYWHDSSAVINTEEIFDKLAEVSEEMHRIDEIFRHMRSFASLNEEPVFERCNLNHSVARTLRLLSRQLEAHGIRVTTELADDLPMVKANLNRLDAVLVNIITNAMQSLDRTEHEHKEILCQTWLEEDCVILQIADNGNGIDEDIMDCIFEPFVTTKASRQGMGLGLSVVHTVISRMGGTVRASNNEGQGATLTITLPIHL